MIDEIFFTLSDVRQIRRVSVNVDEFDLFAQEVQRNFVQRVLGDDLYNELLGDLVSGVPQSARFIELMDGKTYQSNGRTKIYRGLKLYASYLWIYIYGLDSGAKVTPIGVQIFVDEEAENAQSKQEYRQLRDHSMRSANSLEDDIVKYLEDFIDDYPEYSLSDKEEPAEQADFTLRSTAKRYTTPSNNFN